MKLKATRKRPRCCNPDCPTKGVEYTRGLCEPCYRSLRRMIEAGKVDSWEAAEDSALCRVRRPVGRWRRTETGDGKTTAPIVV